MQLSKHTYWGVLEIMRSACFGLFQHVLILATALKPSSLWVYLVDCLWCSVIFIKIIDNLLENTESPEINGELSRRSVWTRGKARNHREALAPLPSYSSTVSFPRSVRHCQNSENFWRKLYTKSMIQLVVILSGFKRPKTVNWMNAASSVTEMQ